MGISKKSMRRWSLLFCIFAIIEGAIWFLGSLFFILIYYDVFTIDVDEGSMLDLLFQIFTSKMDRTIIIFMYIYAILSLTLCLLSALIINAIAAKVEKESFKSYILWSTNFIILSVVDIVLTCFLGKDLSDMFYLTDDPPKELVCAHTIGLIVSLRGVFIWMFNLLASGYMILFASKFKRKDPICKDFINPFEEPSGTWHPSVTSNNPLANAKRGEMYNLGKDTNRSYNSLIANDNLSITTDIFRTPETHEGRLANIGRPGKRATFKPPSPVHVPPPLVPRVKLEKSSESSKDKESITDMFSNLTDNSEFEGEVEMVATTKEFDRNSPYIPPPDYTPPGSPSSLKRTRF